MSKHLLPCAAMVIAIALAGTTPALAGEPPTPVQKLHRAVALRNAGIVVTSLGVTGAMIGSLGIATGFQGPCHVDPNGPTDQCSGRLWTGLVMEISVLPAAAGLLSIGVPMWAVGQHRAHQAHLVITPTLVPRGAGVALAVAW